MKKKTKKLIAIFSILFILIVSITIVVLYIKSCLKPTDEFIAGYICDGDKPCEVTPFVVNEDDYGSDVLNNLEKAGIIKDAKVLYYYNKIFGYSYYAGYYEIPHKIVEPNGNKHGISLDELLAWIATPANAHQDTVWISFDEGGFAEEFAQLIEEKTTVKAKDILAYWNDEQTIRGLMNDYPFLTNDIFNANSRILLEGYLWPDTYEFFEYTNPEDITRKLLDRTLEFYEEYEDDFKNSKLTYHEIFTLASMVQWESGDLLDSPYIAGVFLNRLEHGPEHDIYGLQSTVTACYAAKLTKEDCGKYGDRDDIIATDSIYNTYNIAGFPPGPVCSFNKISLIAALRPNQNDGYYYFSANLRDGGTCFAKTLAQHEYNCAVYFLPYI